MWLEKGNMKDGCGDGNVWYLDCINVHILVVILQLIVLQDVTIEGNWVKGTWDLLVLFLITIREPTIVPKLKV